MESSSIPITFQGECFIGFSDFSGWSADNATVILVLQGGDDKVGILFTRTAAVGGSKYLFESPSIFFLVHPQGKRLVSVSL